MQIQMDQHEDEIETGSSRESQNALGLRQNPFPESSHSVSDHLLSRTATKRATSIRTIGVWWKAAGGLSGKLDQEGGSQADGELDLHERANQTRKLVESKEAGLRRFDVPESAPHDEYYILPRGWVAAPG